MRLGFELRLFVSAFEKVREVNPNRRNIRLRSHGVRDRVANRGFEMIYTPSAEQRADLLIAQLHISFIWILSHAFIGVLRADTRKL